MANKLIHFGNHAEGEAATAPVKSQLDIEKIKASLSPSHYEHPSGIQAIQINAFESFNRGNIIKYVMRAPYAGKEVQDLMKAATYLGEEIERLTEGKLGIAVLEYEESDEEDEDD
jgi:hypothetical protein